MAAFALLEVTRASAEGFGSSCGMMWVIWRGKGRKRGQEAEPGVVRLLQGAGLVCMEKGKYFPISLPGKKQREGWV